MGLKVIVVGVVCELLLLYLLHLKSNGDLIGGDSDCVIWRKTKAAEEFCFLLHGNTIPD